MVTLKLQASDGKAILIVGTSWHNKKWYCAVFLETERESIRLGEEGFVQIRSKMISSLRSPYALDKGSLCGKEVDVFHVLSLMGPHAAIYGVPVKGNADESNSDTMWGVDLYWQTVDMVDHLIMRLSPKDIQSWLTILESTEQLSEGES
jgi:hypothetical protein